MFEIETGQEVWSAEAGQIGSVIATSNGRIYASDYDRKQFLKTCGNAYICAVLCVIVEKLFIFCRF